MDNFKSCLARSFEDSFGFFIMVTISNIISSASSEFALTKYTPSELVRSFKIMCVDEDETLIDVIHVLLTSFFIISLLSIFLAASFIIFYLIYPLFMKIASCIALPFVAYFFISITNFKEYKNHIFIGSALYSVYKIYHSIKFHDSLPYHYAIEFTDKVWRLSYTFFILYAIQMSLVLLDCVILRFLDFDISTDANKILFIIFMCYYLNIPSFSTRLAFTHYFFDLLIPGFIPTSYFNFVAAFFNARAFAATKFVFFGFSIFDTLFYRPYYRITDPEMVTPFEEDRSHSYCCAIFKTSFLKQFSRTKSSLWKGEFRKKMKSVNFKEDLFPALLMSLSIVLFGLKQIQETFFRAQEAAVIVFSHYYIAVEVLNSFIFVEIYKLYYGISEMENEKINFVSEKDISDEIKTGKITVN